jgi:flagellar motor switch protein FliN
MSKAIAEWLVAQWTSRFSEIMLTMGDVQPQMHVAHLDEPVSAGGLLWWEQPFSCAPEEPIWAGAPEEAWAEIGKVVLAAAGVDPAPASEIQSTYLEIVRQSMSSLAQDIGQRIETQVSCPKGDESKPRKSATHCFRIQTEIPTKTVDIFLVIADGLCRTVASPEEGGSDETLPTRYVEEAPAADPVSRTFELLLDVEMPVSVSFGRASLKLHDAIKLITGSLIELDRFLTDPVELLVNNCVIARGEVVVVEGNYGVRITEIVSQKERLQQSRRYLLN